MHEVRICFDERFKMIDCVSTGTTSTCTGQNYRKCDKNFVKYPAQRINCKQLERNQRNAAIKAAPPKLRSIPKQKSSGKPVVTKNTFGLFAGDE